VNEFFEIVVTSHLDQLRSILTTLKRVDSYPLDIVDCARVGDAKRELDREIQSFALLSDAAREEVAA
jgi:hypothetical protein